MISLAKKAEEAFARSAPHPATPRVRLVKTAEDLCAIHHDCVSAAIWRREMPEDAARALRDINAARYPENTGAKEEWIVPRSGMRDIRVPIAIRRDMERLRDIFRGVMDNPKSEKVATYSYRARPAPEYHQAREVFQPHADSHVHTRMIVSYTRDPQLVTEWYPVQAGADEFALAAAFAKSRNVEALKKKSGVQREPHGTVMVFHGLDAPSPLVHAVPVPKRDVFRMVYINTAGRP